MIPSERTLHPVLRKVGEHLFFLLHAAAKVRLGLTSAWSCFVPSSPPFSSLFSHVGCPLRVRIFREIPLNAASIGYGMVVGLLGMSQVGKKKKRNVGV